MAREEVEVSIHNQVYQHGGVRQVPDDGWMNSTAWKMKRKRLQRTKTGGYVPVSELQPTPPRN